MIMFTIRILIIRSRSSSSSSSSSISSSSSSSILTIHIIIISPIHLSTCLPADALGETLYERGGEDSVWGGLELLDR